MSLLKIVSWFSLLLLFSLLSISVSESETARRAKRSLDVLGLAWLSLALLALAKPPLRPASALRFTSCSHFSRSLSIRGRMVENTALTTGSVRSGALSLE